MIRRFLSHVESVLVVEDVAPFLEEALLAEAATMGRLVKIHGRRSGALPGIGETVPELVTEAIASLVKREAPSLSPTIVVNGPTPEREALIQEIQPLIPNRQISFCAGCSHPVAIPCRTQAWISLNQSLYRTVCGRATNAAARGGQLLSFLQLLKQIRQYHPIVRL